MAASGESREEAAWVMEACQPGRKPAGPADLPKGVRRSCMEEATCGFLFSQGLALHLGMQVYNLGWEGVTGQERQAEGMGSAWLCRGEGGQRDLPTHFL